MGTLIPHIATDDLLRLVREHKREGYDLLYAEYGPVLYGIICHNIKDISIAENLLERTFVYIYNHINSYRHTTPLLSWVILAARTICAGYATGGDGSLWIYKDAMEMVFFGGYSYDRAAKESNLPIERVKTEIRNSLKSMNTDR